MRILAHHESIYISESIKIENENNAKNLKSLQEEESEDECVEASK